VIFIAVQYLYVSTTPTYSHETLFYIPFNGVGSKQSSTPLLHQQIDSKSSYSSNLAALLLANATVGPSVLEILVAHAGRNTSNIPAPSATNPEESVNNQNTTEKPLCPVIPPKLGKYGDSISFYSHVHSCILNLISKEGLLCTEK